MAGKESRKCRGCGVGLPDDAGYVSIRLKNGDWEHECSDCRAAADVAAIVESTWQIFHKLDRKPEGVKMSDGLTDDARIQAAAALAAALWEGR